MNSTTQAPSGAAAVDGRSRRWARHREERRAELLDLARKVIHARGPDVTMEDIAAASGTSKSIVYRYVEDKSQLQRLLGERILSGMHERLLAEIAELEARLGRPATPEERIRQMIAAYVATVERSENVYRFVTRPSAGLNHFLDRVARLTASFLPDSVPQPQLWARGAVGFVEASVDAWMQERENRTAPPASSARAPHEDVSSTQLADHLTTWLMKGLQP